MPRLRPHITVVGLGPAGTDFLGDGAARLLAAPGRAYLRTARHPAAAGVEGVRSFDDLYESAATFGEVYAGIVEALVSAAKDAAPEPVVYAVPGSPLVAERSVELLRADDRVGVTVVPALSFLDLAWSALGIDPLAEGVRLVDAGEFGSVAAGEGGPFLVAQCWSRQVLSDVKLSLQDDAGAALPRPVILHHLGLEDEVVAAVDWWELDRTVEADHLTSLYVPALGDVGQLSAGAEVARLSGLVDTLRERCPWDRAQTHASLMPHLVEECYEVLDALSALDEADRCRRRLCAPGGGAGRPVVPDRVPCPARRRGGPVRPGDIARGVHDKLVHRHPHVFGDVEADSADQVVSNWEAIKKSEKGRNSVTEGIPAALPALMLTNKLARKARSVGVEPEDATGEQAAETLGSLTRRAGGGERDATAPRSGDADDAHREVGQLLFTVANLAQRLGVDAEQALRERALSLRGADPRGRRRPR